MKSPFFQFLYPQFFRSITEGKELSLSAAAKHYRKKYAENEQFREAERARTNAANKRHRDEMEERRAADKPIIQADGPMDNDTDTDTDTESLDEPRMDCESEASSNGSEPWPRMDCESTASNVSDIPQLDGAAEKRRKNEEAGGSGTPTKTSKFISSFYNLTYTVT